MDTAKFYASKRKEARDLLDKEGMSEAWAEQASRELMGGEAYVEVAAMWLCEDAGDRRRSQRAQQQAMAEQALDLIRAGHRILSVLGAELDVLDIPGEGGR